MSGNVSLYNETQGRGIPPTPSIGGVGIVDDVTKIATLSFKAAGESIVLIGATRGWLGQSCYLADICGREEGAPPPVDLAAERSAGDLVRQLIGAGHATAVHDLSDGGLAVALAEMAIAGGVGATIEAISGLPAHAWLFGEDQGRYLVTARPDEAARILDEATKAGVEARIIGATGGDSLTLPGEAPILIADLGAAHEAWFPEYMASVR